MKSPFNPCYDFQRMKDRIKGDISYYYTYHSVFINKQLIYFSSGVKCNAAPPLAFSFKTSLSPAFILL